MDEEAPPEEFEYDESKQLLDKKKDWCLMISCLEFKRNTLQVAQVGEALIIFLFSFKDGEELRESSRNAE